MAKFNGATPSHVNKMLELIQRLKADLERYAASPKAIPAVVQGKQGVINQLVDYFNNIERIINRNNRENVNMAKQILWLKNQVAMHQAILIIHGVYNFPMWLAKGWAHLQHEAVRADREKFYKIPDKLAEDLTTEERQMFADRMERYQHQQFINSLKELPNSDRLIEKYNQLRQNA